MAAKAKIRIIKKGAIKKVEKLASVAKETHKEAVREMVATVMNWVSDFENRKLEETRLAIEQFQHT